MKDFDFFWTLMGGIDRSLVYSDLIDSIIENSCSRVHYSIESNNFEILRRHGKFKRTSNLQLEKSSEYIEKLAYNGIEVFCDFMIGFPEETISDIQNTIDYAKNLKDLGMSFAEFSCVTPFPGTALYEKCYKLGYIVNPLKFEDYTLTKGNIATNNFTADQITEFRLKALKEVNGFDIFKETRERLHRPIINRTYKEKIRTQ